MYKKIIPIALVFDNNYVIPAAVAMYSLMEHSNPNCMYEFNIVHHGLSVANQKKLIKNLENFKNKNIKFIYCDISFEQIFNNLKLKGHFSPAMFYKLILPSLLPNYDKIIVSDVDVIFCADVSQIYSDFKGPFYIGAVHHYSKSLKEHLKLSYSQFSSQYERKINHFGAGFFLLNLKKMREDKIEEKMICFLKDNINNLIYPEQEVLNYICSNNVKYIGIKYMVVPMWILLDKKNNEINSEYYLPYKKDEVIEALKSPVQLHYATSIKPWNNYNCNNFQEWFKILSKTIFLKTYLQNLSISGNSDVANLPKMKRRYVKYRVLSKITFGKRRKKYKHKRKELKAKIKQVKHFLRGK